MEQSFFDLLIGAYEERIKMYTTPPESFTDLVHLIEQRYRAPSWYWIPLFTLCPELSRYTGRSLLQYEKQDMLSRIELASIQTNRQPLCIPDYFFYDEVDKKRILEKMFQTRGNFYGIAWELSIKSKKAREHPDWATFCRFIKKAVPSGEFLFRPNAWDKTWFAREIVEQEDFQVRVEIVELVNSLGYKITLPQPRVFRRNWSRSDREIIKQAATKYWAEWRQEAERNLEYRVDARGDSVIA